MADLIGTASIRIDMPTAAATRSIRRMAERSEAPLNQMKLRVSEVRKELRRLQDANVKITLDDQTAAGAATARSAVQALRDMGPVRIDATIDDQTTAGLLAAREAADALRSLGPVRIPVTLDDDTGAPAAAIRATVAGLQSLGPVRITAELDSDLTAIGATTIAFNELRDAVRRVSTALGTLATRATTATAALVALGAAARSLRGDVNDLDEAVRRTRDGMTGLNTNLGTVTLSAGSAGGALDGLKSAALLLAPALIPIAAQAAPIAASLAAATVAIGIFGAAAGGQIAAMSEAADAEKKYKDAVDEYGATSQQATKAQAAFQRSVQDMPHPTRVASIALSNLKDSYREWSDSLAASTMPVATRSFALFGALFPKLTPVVEGAGVQLKRFVTIATGGVQSAAFDRFMKSFAEFSTGALSRGNDALIRFTRTLNTGKISGGVSEFMEYVRANGPLVRDTLSNLAQALGNTLQGAANVGPGLLTVVNALAGLVAAVPPGVITAMLQLALALKAVRLAAAGMAAAGVAAASFGAAITAMQTAAAGATGVLPRLAAAFGALSRSAKVAVAGTGIGLLVIALSELSQRGRQAPPDIDKLTTSLARLGTTGKVTGEAAKAFGTDLDGLYGKVRSLTDPSTTDKVQQFLVGWTGWDSTPVKDAKENFDSVDKALAGLVKNNQADLAAAAVKRLTAEYGKGGRNTKEFTSRLDDYKASIADAKFEQQLAADAMGLFGAQAQQTSAKLAEQKASADGLRQAIQALNDVNRAGLGAQNAFEASIDALAEVAKKGAGSLRYVNGELDLNAKAARDADAALRDTAVRTEEYAGAARDSGASWEKVNGIYAKGRKELIAQATQFFGSEKAARQYVGTILNIPDEKTTRFKMDKEDAQRGLEAFNSAVKKTPGTKSVTLKTLSKGAEAILESFGLKVKRLPNGKVTVTAANGQALGAVKDVQGALARLPKSRRINITINHFTKRTQRIVTEYQTKYLSGRSQHDITGATGGLYTGSGFKYRGKGYAAGGLVNGPGTETSDSVMAPWLSKNEFVVNAKQTARNLPLLKAINSGQMGMAAGGMAGAGAAVGDGLVSGLSGATRAVEDAARALAAAVTSGVRDELQIASPSKAMKALAKDVGAGFIKGLTDSRDKIKAVSKDLASDVRAAFSGRRETALVKMIGRNTDRLLSEAKKRDAVTKKIAEAKAFSSDTASKASATGSLGSIVQEDFFAPSFVEKRMRQSLASIKAFTANVQKLQKKGLSKNLLRQVLEMGPAEGGGFAKSLAGADPATIKRYNKLQSDIGAQSKRLGNAGADMLYDSGKKAGQGFLTGLKAQQKQIENLMLSIAKGMQKAIRRALGIKSPSIVMAGVGRLSMDGLRGGLLKEVPRVEQAMGRVSDAVVSAAPGRMGASAVAIPGVGSTRSGGKGAGAVVHHHHYYQFTNDGVIGSRLELDNWLTKSLDRLARTRRMPASLTGTR